MDCGGQQPHQPSQQGKADGKQQHRNKSLHRRADYSLLQNTGKARGSLRNRLGDGVHIQRHIQYVAQHLRQLVQASLQLGDNLSGLPSLQIAV